MPYIAENLRGEINEKVDELVLILRELEVRAPIDGVVNYTLTRIVDEMYGGGGYSVFNRALGVLDCAAREFYRRKVAPYEDQKMAENGDVYGERFFGNNIRDAWRSIKGEKDV